MPDRHRQKKSKYTLDRQMPGAFEGETVTRRTMMNLVANGAGAVAAAAFTLPALGFALAPIFKRQVWTWQPVGHPADFTEAYYVTKVINITPGIGEAGNTIAYVRKRDPAIDLEPEDQYNHFVALSDRCMHLGCPVRYVQAARAVHLPVPRRRVRLPRDGRRRAAGPAAGPLLHAVERDHRPRRARPAVLGQ